MGVWSTWLASLALTAGPHLVPYVFMMHALISFAVHTTPRTPAHATYRAVHAERRVRHGRAQQPHHAAVVNGRWAELGDHPGRDLHPG